MARGNVWGTSRKISGNAEVGAGTRAARLTAARRAISYFAKKSGDSYIHSV